jgi:hypothetical protein
MGDATSLQLGSEPMFLEPLLETEQVDPLMAANSHRKHALKQLLLSDAAVQGRRTIDEEYLARDAPQAPAATNLTGMALYAGSSLSLTAMLSCAHELTRRHGVPVFEVIFVRETTITAMSVLAGLISWLTLPASKHQSRTHR